MFEFCVTDSNTLLKPDAAISGKVMCGNLERREQVRTGYHRYTKVEKPASIGCRPKAKVSNVCFISHEFS
jgi:hypothetical protein